MNESVSCAFLAQEGYNLDQTKEIYFVDALGAKIGADFITEYIAINEKGVIIEVKQHDLDYIELDTLPSTITATTENGLFDQSYSDIASSIGPEEETSDTQLLRTYLLRASAGNQIIQEYQNIGQLRDRSRKLLVNVAVSYLMQNSFNKKPTKLEKEIVAKSIIDIFPKLKDIRSALGYEAFYNPLTGSGFITNRLKTVKRNTTTDFQQPKKQCVDSNDNSENIDSTKIEEDIRFLKFATKDTPVEEIFERMRNSFFYRRKIKNKIEEFPRFIDTYGLIQQDFKLLFPNKDLPERNQFIEFRQKLFTIYDSTITRKTFDPNLESLNVWDKNINCILCLIHLLPPTARGRYKAQRETATNSENHFIYFQKTGTSLSEVFVKKLTKQPFLVGVGTSKGSLYQYYVCLDNHLFEAGKDGYEAVDILFKSHFVFNIEYDINLKSAYSFLQTEFYRIEENVIVTPRMRELRAKLYNT